MAMAIQRNIQTVVVGQNVVAYVLLRTYSCFLFRIIFNLLLIILRGLDEITTQLLVKTKSYLLKYYGGQVLISIISAFNQSNSYQWHLNRNSASFRKGAIFFVFNETLCCL